MLALGAAATCRVRLGSGTSMLEGREAFKSPSRGWGIKIRAEEGDCSPVAHHSLGVLVCLLAPRLGAVFQGSSLPGEAPLGFWHTFLRSLPHGFHRHLPPHGAEAEQLSVPAPVTEASSHLEQKPRLRLTAALTALIVTGCNGAKAHPSQETGAISAVVFARWSAQLGPVQAAAEQRAAPGAA